MKNAAIYTRYSPGPNQREESIDAQIRACKIFAKKYDYNIVSIYTDRKKSGSKALAKRTDFARMMEACKTGAFEAVMVHKLNRFGRNALELLQNKQTLEQHGIELISVQERLDSTPEGKLLLMVMAGINEFYSANLANEVMKGLMENAYNCKHTGGRPPLGYDVGPDKKYVINEQEAAAVRIIFEMYDSGAGYGQIINHLNGLGYKTKRGEAFGKNSLHEILRNA